MKTKKSVFIVILLTILVTILIGTAAMGQNTNYELSTEEKAYLAQLNPDLIRLDTVESLKKTGHLDEYIKELKQQYKIQYESEQISQDKQLKEWGLNRQTTIEQLRNETQQYLDQNQNGIKLDSKEFSDLVDKMFTGDEYPLEKMAEEDPAFGPAYLYMSYYYARKNASRDNSVYKDEKVTIGTLTDEDFKLDFGQVNAVQILNEFADKY